MTNQTTMTGPNRRPTLPVPRDWSAKSPTRMTSVAGTTKFAASGLNFSPSIAERTEIAGVMTPSPYSNAAPITPSSNHKRQFDPLGGLAVVLDQGQQRQNPAFAVIVGA